MLSAVMRCSHTHPLQGNGITDNALGSSQGDYTDTSPVCPGFEFRHEVCNDSVSDHWRQSQHQQCLTEAA